MFSVKGSLHAPAIEPIAVESVGAGINGVCQIGPDDFEKYAHFATKNIVP